ncbi:cryptochrome/photolyase family protein [bacterium]|nr:cryptochrome/photolyase family protein [bacterium]
MSAKRRSDRSAADRQTNVREVAVWILPDQLLPPAEHPAIRAALDYVEGNTPRVRIVIVESHRHFTALPYHRKRLTLILSATRHYAEELRSAGFSVDIVHADNFSEGLRTHWRKYRWNCLFTMEGLEWPTVEMQRSLAERADGETIRLVPNSQFLWPGTELARPKSRNVIQENFYRTMRRKFGLLMEPDGSPAGDRWNFDAENRRPLPRGAEFPPIPRFEPDAITRQVMTEVDERFPDAVGSTEGFALPVTRQDAQAAFADFLENRLADFGPFEDAMSRENGTLWHSQLSPAMNLGLIDALEMCRTAERAYREGRAPLPSVEGFIRQIIGWREFVHWQYVRQGNALRHANGWSHTRPTPRFWWDGQTEMACMKSILGRLHASAMNHHIERLMVLCNFAMLAGIDPEAVANWFLVWYADSHDWVVLPNVIGMGLNADGGKTATKPYIASAAYINKMSDFCSGCEFDPKIRTGPKACPFNILYWNFLITHEPKLRANPRMGPNVLGLRHLKPDERDVIQHEAREFLEKLEPWDDPVYSPDLATDRTESKSVSRLDLETDSRGS